VDPDCVGAAEEAARLLADLGHAVEEAAPDYDAAALHRAWRVIVGAILAVQVASYAEAHGIADPLAKLEAVNAAWVEEGGRRPATDYFRAETVLQGVGRRVGAFFARYDALLTPSTAAPAPKLGAFAGTSRDLDDFCGRTFGLSPFTAVFNATGGPAASIPFGSTAEGLSV